jgi:surface protein
MRKIIILCLALLLAIGLQAQQTFGTATPVNGGTVSLNVDEITTTAMDDGSYVVVFPQGSNQTFNVPEGVTSIEYLLVGGGGGGGYATDRTAGGGSGGRVAAGSLSVESGEGLTISVGTGGQGGRWESNGGDSGGASILSAASGTITAPGGGPGSQIGAGAQNGGGASHNVSSASYYSNDLTGVSATQYSGGNGYQEFESPRCNLIPIRYYVKGHFAGGGGAGNNGNGQSGSSSGGGNGGNGYDSNITGVSLGYGGGGGGSYQALEYGASSSNRGFGTDGGGDGGVYRIDTECGSINGASSIVSTTSGTDGRGGGGGGGRSNINGPNSGESATRYGGDGGDGVLVLRYYVDNEWHIANGVCKCEGANFGDSANLALNGIVYTFTKRTRADLDALIAAQNWDDVRYTCTSGITDMSYLFRDTAFNSDISHWDFSNVTTMQHMFSGSASFNQSVESWDVSNVSDMSYMFSGNNTFNRSLNNWDVSGVTNMQGMFSESGYNQSLDNWDVSNVVNMSYMFNNADSFNQYLDTWDVSSVTNMAYMFSNADNYNHSLDNWDVSSVTNMQGMFSHTNNFNQSLNDWDVSSVTDMSFMFAHTTAFNNFIYDWDVANVTTMESMFENASRYDKTMNSWTVSNVTNMRRMFYNSVFSGIEGQDMVYWDISSVTNMEEMFYNATNFNRDISAWNPQSAVNLSGMFQGATLFNQDLRSWCVENIPTEPTNFATGSGLASGNYPNWGSCGSSDNANFIVDGNTCKCPDATLGESANMIVNGITGTFTKRDRDGILAIKNDNNLTDDVKWDLIQKTCTSGITDMSELLNNSGFNKNINHWDVSSVTNMKNIFNLAAGMNSPLNYWDVSSVTNMEGMFYKASSFNRNIGNWDVSNVTNMSFMFGYAALFNQNINNWDVSNVTNMRFMFANTNLFNKPLNNWDVSNVTDMGAMFSQAVKFNQPLDNWDVSNVTSMSGMFFDTTDFNQPLNSWDVHDVTNMSSMFRLAKAFNQPLDAWVVRNVTDMNFMFDQVLVFNQDLSSWCTGFIDELPLNFAADSALSQDNFPNWVPCGNATIDLDNGDSLADIVDAIKSGKDVTVLSSTPITVEQELDGPGDLFIETHSITFNESIEVRNLSITTTNSTSFTGSNKTVKANGDITLNTDVTVSGSLTLIANKTTLNKGKYLEITGALTNNTVLLDMLSDSDEFSSLRVNGGTFTGSGAMAYNRYLNTTPGNELISAPFAGMNFGNFINDSNGRNVIFNGSVVGGGSYTYYLFGPYVPQNNAFNNYKILHGASTSIQNYNTLILAGRGYRSGRMPNAASETVIFKTPDNFDYTTLTSNISIDVLGDWTEGEGWNLVGNPYPCYLDLEAVLQANGSMMHQSSSWGVYAYNGSNTNTAADWTIFNMNNATGVTIAPGQGFFIRAERNGSFTFTPSMQVNTGGDDFVSGRSAGPQYVKLRLDNGEHQSHTRIYLHANGTNGLDIGYDSSLFGSTLPTFALYTHLLEGNEGRPMGIQTLNSDVLNSATVTVIPLGVEAAAGAQLTFSLAELQLPEGTQVVLEDALHNRFTNLNAQDYMVNTSSALTGTGRFYLHMSNDTTLSAGTEAYSGIQVYAPNGSGVVVVTGVTEPNMQLSLYDITGRKLLSHELNAASMQEIPVSQLSTGAVIAHLEGSEGSRSIKLIINP